MFLPFVFAIYRYNDTITSSILRLASQIPLNITINLPDDLIERLVSGSLLTDDAISQLLADALTIRGADAAPSKSPYYTLFDQTHDAVFMIALDGRMMHVNPRAVQLTGYTVDELITMSINDLSAGSMDGPNVLAKLVRGEKLPPFERRIRTRAGEVIQAEVTAELVRGARGAPWYVQTIVRDITLRKQAEKILRDSEALLRQIIDLAPVHIFAKDADSRYLLANQSVADAYGTTTAALIGKTDAEMSRRPEEAEGFVSQDRQVIETGCPVVIPEVEFTDGQGRKRILRTIKIPLQFPDREGLAVLGVSSDITEMKQAEAEVRQAYRQAYELAVERQHVQILTQFIQDSSHEFRTPLSVISTSIYLMTRTKDDAKRAAHAAQAHTQITRITRLIDQLQTMADLDSNIPFEYGPLNVNVLLREIATEIAEDAKQRGLTVETALLSSLPPVTADAERLRQAFEHVIENALRFTTGGGSISIATRFEDQQVVIEVSDTGVGIPSELVPHALRRFWRRDQAHTTPGFGLGLPIVQKIVDRHSGRLTLQSRCDCGTIVTITLPVMA